MTYGFQDACRDAVKEATAVFNNAVRTAAKHGVSVDVSLINSEIQQVKTKISIPPAEDEDDLLG